MNKILLKTTCKKQLADLHTPVGIYLKIRDKFPNSVLLESADNSIAENSFSFIGIQPIAGIKVHNGVLSYYYPNQNLIEEDLEPSMNISEKVWGFIQSFELEDSFDSNLPQGFIGYTSYEGIQLLRPNFTSESSNDIPEFNYQLYQYLIAIDHYKNEMFICENSILGMDSHIQEIEKLIRTRDYPEYPFTSVGNEKSNFSDPEFVDKINKAIQKAKEAEVSQLVLSRSFSKNFSGDEFNVYRCLRSINPSPYLFYFDYGAYKIFGSSPESQLVIKDGKAIMHPIAGTVKRTGDEEKDMLAIQALKVDPKENTEHDMLVDLAMQELKIFSSEVKISYLKKVKKYSHVIHLVSQLVGKIKLATNPFEALSISLPAGTLSGAPKEKAMELIKKYEKTPREFYAGCIGFVGFDGSLNKAIIIRSFLSQDQSLRYQAGAGIIAESNSESELQEVNNKVNALRQAVAEANRLFSEA